MDKKNKEEKSKPKVEPVRTPKGMLPRKQRGPVTTGYRMDGREVSRGTSGAERYCPSRRVKSAHRKSGSEKSLRAFAEAHPACGDWLRNKAASGRG